MNWQSLTKNISERKRLKYNVLYRTRSAITHTIFSWLYWGSGLWKKWSWSLRWKILFWDTYLCNLCAVLIAHTQGNCSPKIVYNNSDRWGDGEWGVSYYGVHFILLFIYTVSVYRWLVYYPHICFRTLDMYLWHDDAITVWCYRVLLRYRMRPLLHLMHLILWYCIMNLNCNVLVISSSASAGEK